MSDDNETQMRKIVADVAAAYFNNSHVTPSEISTVINQIATSLMAVGAPAAAAAIEPTAEATARPKLTSGQIRKSITRDSLVSFEDGKPYKTLRRHLAAKGLTPEQYKDKWGLPKDYPMVAPAYSEARATMARSIGLGARGAASRSRSPSQAAAFAAEPNTTAPAAQPEPASKAKRPPKARPSTSTRRRRPKNNEAAGG